MSPKSPTIYLCKWACIYWWPFSPPCGRNDKHQKWKSKNACQVDMSDGSTTNQTKGMRKSHWTLIEITCGMWWYERGRAKPRWKTLMISNDAIHVQVEGREDGNVKGIDTPKVDNSLCSVHDVWWRVKTILLATYKGPQLGQGTCGRCWWDRWALGVGTND